MSYNPEKLSQAFNTAGKTLTRAMVYSVRDEAGITPNKVRVTMYAKSPEGKDIILEVETKVDVESYNSRWEQTKGRVMRFLNGVPRKVDAD